MPKRALLVEPIDFLADWLSEVLSDLGYQVDVVRGGDVDDQVLHEYRYDCALINLDQNRSTWHDYGLTLARKVTRHGVPVVMIPDSRTAQATIAAAGWHQARKPFTAEEIAGVIAAATGSAISKS